MDLNRGSLFSSPFANSSIEVIKGFLKPPQDILFDLRMNCIEVRIGLFLKNKQSCLRPCVTSPVQGPWLSGTSYINAGIEVVPGDLIVLSEGDRVLADAELLFCTNLSADESLLTGESVSVRKICSDGKTTMAEPEGDDLPFVYSGSLIVQGQGGRSCEGYGRRNADRQDRKSSAKCCV
jgi:hypothetical protein